MMGSSDDGYWGGLMRIVAEGGTQEVYIWFDMLVMVEVVIFIGR